MIINDFIVCDDIRREIANKHTLVGVYNDTINFEVRKDDSGKWPKVLKLGIFVRINFEENEPLPDKFSMHVRFSDSEERLVAQGELTLSRPELRNLIIAVVHGRFEIPKQSTMAFVLRFFRRGDQISELSPIPRIVVAEQIIEG